MTETIALVAGLLIAGVAFNEYRMWRARPAVPRAEDTPVTEPPKPVLHTEESLAHDVRVSQWESEKLGCDSMIRAECGEIANAKLLLRIHPVGGIKDNIQTIRRELQRHIDRQQLLMTARLELDNEEHQPLPLPSELVVATADLKVIDG